MMFALFPHAAKVLERDRGFCNGPRPIYFFDLDHQNSVLHRILSRNPRIVVLFRDEFDVHEDNDRVSENAKEFDFTLKRIIPDTNLVG